MNKLERYFNKNDRFNWLWNKATEYNGKYLISDTYSIICLNKVTNNIDIIDMKQLKNNVSDFEGFTYWYDLKYDFDFKTLKIKDIKKLDNIIVDTKNIDIKCDTRYSLNYELAKKIYNIIKFDKIEVYYKWCFNEFMVVFKLVNNSANELAYMLPQRVF